MLLLCFVQWTPEMAWIWEIWEANNSCGTGKYNMCFLPLLLISSANCTVRLQAGVAYLKYHNDIFYAAGFCIDRVLLEFTTVNFKNLVKKYATFPEI